MAVEKGPQDIGDALRMLSQDAAVRAGLPEDAFDTSWKVGEVLAGRMAVEEAGPDIVIADDGTVGLVVDSDVFDRLKGIGPRS